jgi:hypothetical protein
MSDHEQNCSATAERGGAASGDPPLGPVGATPAPFFGSVTCQEPNPNYQQDTGPRERGRDLRNPSQDEIDAGLERVITTACLFATNVAKSDPQLSREVFAIMGQLIERRSPEQRARMEARLPEPWRS